MQSHVRSRDTDNKYLPVHEKFSWVTVSVCALSWSTTFHVAVSQIIISLYSCFEALQVDASTRPSFVAAKLKISKPCPYSFCTSGHRVFCMRRSSTGGLLIWVGLKRAGSSTKGDFFGLDASVGVFQLWMSSLKTALLDNPNTGTVAPKGRSKALSSDSIFAILEKV